MKTYFFYEQMEYEYVPSWGGYKVAVPKGKELVAIANADEKAVIADLTTNEPVKLLDNAGGETRQFVFYLRNATAPADLYTLTRQARILLADGGASVYAEDDGA